MFALLATTLLSVATAEETTTLRVLCYNIHYGQVNDGRYELQRLANVINSTKPDLIALQEVDVGVERSGRVHQARTLGELTDMAVRYGPTQHYQGGLFGNAVLTRLPILDVHIQPLPYTESTPDRTTYPRGAIAVTVQLPDGSPLKFVSTHFQHNVPEDRVAEAEAINQLFGHEDQLPTILAGDMNATPNSEPIRVLQKQWSAAIDPQAAPTAPSGSPRSRIDYVFYRGATLKVVDSRVIAEPMASDHRPVLAVFELN
ncbi:MAG: endonuclease/exonuclease/phosphatase family protein [Fuerstiella sp.]